MSDAELLKYDTRARERLLRSGVITAEQVRIYLESLPDGLDKSEAVAVDQPALHRGEGERHGAGAPARALDAGTRVAAPAPEAAAPINLQTAPSPMAPARPTSQDEPVTAAVSPPESMGEPATPSATPGPPEHAPTDAAAADKGTRPTDEEQP